MGKEVATDDFLNSYDAVKEYFELDENNNVEHLSKIIIKRGGEIVYNNKLNVRVSIQTNETTVDIDGDAEYEENYHPGYSSKYQYYSIQGSSLVIKADDLAGRKIELIISSAL